MRTLFLSFVLISVTGCSGPSPEMQKEAEDRGMLLAAQKIVRDRLKDPGSAEFRNERIRQFQGKDVACGEVNANNSFGGKTGFKRYIAQSETVVVTEEEMTPAEFAEAWAKIC